MAKTNQDFTMYAGDTENIDVTVYKSDGVTPLPISGATVDWYMKSGNRPLDTSILIHKSTSSGISITNASGGVFQVTLDPSDTQNYSNGAYTHYARVTDVLGNVSTVTVGTITII